jgi:hypothetical protein
MMMDNFNIPKIVHYCWFGQNEKPEKIKKCIESWKKHLGDYQFIEWNEENFDVYQNAYIEQAYHAKKFAFVSDVARLRALYEYGGIYFDTDVEVFKTFDELLNHKCLLGFEEGNYIATSFMACEKSHPLIVEFISEYMDASFLGTDGSLNLKTNVKRLTSILGKKGLDRNDKYQTLENGIVVFPKEYFSPYDYINCVKDITNNSYCVHHFYISWMPWQTRAKKFLKSLLVKMIGRNNMKSIRKTFLLNKH